MKFSKTIKISMIVLALCTVGLLPLGCGSGTTQTSTDQVVTVQRGNIVTQITSVGNLDFSETTDVTFDITCTISEVLAVAGDSVKQGQVLCRFDTTTWQNEINTLSDTASAALHNLTTKKHALIQAQQALLSAQLGLQTANNTILSKQIAYTQAQIALQNAQLALENAEQSTTDQLQLQVKRLQVQLAQQQLDVAKLDLDNAKAYAMPNAQAALDDAIAALDNAQGTVTTAQAASDDASKTLTDAQNAGPQVRAPVDGLITNVNVVKNQDVKTGDVAVTIANPTKFRASIMVSELNILKVKIGGLATVQVEVLSGTTYPATVSSIAPVATISSGVVNYQVQVQLSRLPVTTSSQTFFGGSGAPGGTSNNFTAGSFGSRFGSENLTQSQISQLAQNRQRVTSTNGTQLLQGLTVTVSLITAQANNVLLVPTGAITSQGGTATVQVMVNGVAQSREVKTGISNSSYTEITSGLTEGEQVVVNLASSSAGSSSSAQRTANGGGLFFGR